MFLAASILPLSCVFEVMLFINSYLRDLSRTFRMVQEVQRTVFRHGLAFYGTVAFVASFLGARIFATLLSRGRKHIEKEVINLSRKERLTQLGVFIGAFSVIFFAAGNWEIGFAVLGLGVLAYLWGEREPRPKSLRSLAS